MPTESELAQAFAPGTLPGIADAWSNLNKEIKVLQGRRDHLEMILLEASSKEHNGAEEPWWEGTIIEGETCAVQAFNRLVDGGEHPRYARDLRYVRKP